MAERDDIEALARAWRDITDEVELSVGDALRRQRRQRLVLLLEVVFGAFAFATAVYFLLAEDLIVFRVAALLIIAAGVTGGLVARRTRVALLKWADWTPEGVLAFRLRDCEVALLTAWHALLACAVLVVFAGFVWLAAALEWDALPPGFPALYASVVAVCVTVVSGWALWRLRVKRAERGRLRALMAEFEQS